MDMTPEVADQVTREVARQLAVSGQGEHARSGLQHASTKAQQAVGLSPDGQQRLANTAKLKSYS